MKPLVLLALVAIGCASGDPAPGGQGGAGGEATTGAGGATAPPAPTQPCVGAPAGIQFTFCDGDPVCTGDACSVAVSGCSYRAPGATGDRELLAQCTFSASYMFAFAGHPAGTQVTYLCYGPGSAAIGDLADCPAGH